MDTQDQGRETRECASAPAGPTPRSRATTRAAAARLAMPSVVRVTNRCRAINDNSVRYITMIQVLADAMNRARSAEPAAIQKALVGFTRALALEWALHGIQVTGIAPGPFPDPVTAGEAGYAERVENARRVVPLRREGRLREVGLLSVYLASRASTT